MTNPNSKNTVKVKIDIQPGHGSPQAWKRFWEKLVADCQEMTRKGGGSSQEDK